MSLSVEKCLQAWTNSLRQMSVRADVVFFGDSLTYYGDFTSLFPNKVVCNLGLRGDTLKGMSDRVDQLRILEPKKVFLMAGLNDVASCDVREFGCLFEELVHSVLSQTKGSDVIIQSLLPVNDKEFFISCGNSQIVACNKEIAAIAEKYSLRYLDLFSCYEHNGVLPRDLTIDGIHLRHESYSIWIDALKEELQIGN